MEEYDADKIEAIVMEPDTGKILAMAKKPDMDNNNLPRNDAQTTTSSGDIVLYSGNQIVVFYGSNSWAYTRLGHITDQDEGGMAQLLGNGDVTITISMEDKK